MLHPGSKGWIRKYFSLIESYEDVLNKYAGSILTPQELIYAYLQPTGIMYGYPTSLLFLDNNLSEKWTNEETFKVLLLEGLVLIDHIEKGNFDAESLEKSIGNFVKFYEDTELEQAKKGWLNFKGLSVFDKLESILEQRVDIKTSFSNKIWTNYLYNSLIFHDLLLYHEYHLGTSPKLLAVKRAVIMLDMVKVVAAAANSDGEATEEEEAIFEIFIASANLDSEQHAVAEDFFKSKRELKDIAFNYDKSWLLSRFILEVAILTVWSDNEVVPAEHVFLNQLIIRLDIDEEEKDKSLLAIQHFIYKNGDKIPFLTGKNDVEMLMSGATERWSKILGRNKDKLAAELSQSKELVGLIAKSTTSELSKDEKEKVKKQFKDLARTIPSLTLFLPIVLKIIPDLVPSAFRTNEIDEDKKEQ